jgi:peptidoglycan/xylan/chitin deacetylase (PgdA/CDA1 family)
MYRAFGSRAHDRFGIALYHRVVPDPAGVPDAVSPRHFREQLEGLLALDFHFTSLASALEASSLGHALPARTVVLTFDDGYANVHDYAFPILEELSIPATVFVVTEYVDSDEAFPFDPWGRHNQTTAPESAWRPLTWSECQRLNASGLVEIGSHTHTHRDFRNRPEEFEADLRASLSMLEQRIGGGARSFAFPFGGVRAGFASPALVDAARRTGVRCALTTEIELADPQGDPFGWGRVEGVQSDSALSLGGKLTGWYEWMGATRRVFQRVAPR